MIDLNDVGVKYYAKDSKGNKISFHIIYYESLMNLVGLEDCTVGNFLEYEKVIKENVKGLVENPYDVTWYSTTTYQSDLVEAVKLAVKEGNNIIVIEYTDVL